MPPSTDEVLEGLRLLQDQQIQPGWKAIVQSGINEIDRLRSALDPLARSADTAVALMKQFYPAEAASLNAHVAVAKIALSS